MSGCPYRLSAYSYCRQIAGHLIFVTSFAVVAGCYNQADLGDDNNPPDPINSEMGTSTRDSAIAATDTLPIITNDADSESPVDSESKNTPIAVITMGERETV